MSRSYLSVYRPQRFLSPAQARSKNVHKVQVWMYLTVECCYRQLIGADDGLARDMGFCACGEVPLVRSRLHTIVPCRRYVSTYAGPIWHVTYWTRVVA